MQDGRPCPGDLNARALPLFVDQEDGVVSPTHPHIEGAARTDSIDHVLEEGAGMQVADRDPVSVFIPPGSASGAFRN